jgi:uncharacterized protein (DUF1330 family)
MAAYALAHLYNPNPHPEVIEYLERIQDTLDPFEGRFLVHGPRIVVAEGEWPGTLVIIEFPDVERASAWYAGRAFLRFVRGSGRYSDHFHGQNADGGSGDPERQRSLS